MTLFRLHKVDDSVFCSVNRKVAAHISPLSCELRATSLADEDFAGANFLATKALDAKALTGVIMDVLSGSTRFDM